MLLLNQIQLMLVSHNYDPPKQNLISNIVIVQLQYLILKNKYHVTHVTCTYKYSNHKTPFTKRLDQGLRRHVLFYRGWNITTASSGTVCTLTASLDH